MFQITQCKDILQKPSLQQKGEYWVLYNYAISEHQFLCAESITYTTHGDYSFLDNIEPLVTRWQGPISIALYAPGDDLQPTVDSIRYLRQCRPEIIRNFVTFHVYFINSHMPKSIPSKEYLQEAYDCSIPPPFANVNVTNMYKTINELLYPVNVGRNIARLAAQTHFILPSDIELYPSKGVIKKFLAMIARNEVPLTNSTNPRVFPLVLFEVNADQVVPENKTRLQEMLRNRTAIPFHKYVCPNCHNVPNGKEWVHTPENNEINVFFIGKRQKHYGSWEPIFIGTNAVPFYEERQSWEGKSDKMTQGYALCVLDYDFMILDNAFLVHRPGIKHYKGDPARDRIVGRTFSLIHRTIIPELKILYGVREGCHV